MQLQIMIEVTHKDEDARSLLITEIRDLFHVRTIHPSQTVSVTSGIVTSTHDYLSFDLNGALQITPEQRRFFLQNFYHVLLTL